MSEHLHTYLPGVWCVHLFLSFKFLLFLHKSHFSFQTQHFPACKSNTGTIKIYPTEKMTKIHFYVDIWWVQPTTKSQYPLPCRDIGHILLWALHFSRESEHFVPDMDIIYFCYLLRLHFSLCVQSRGLPVDKVAHKILVTALVQILTFPFMIRLIRI